MSKKMLEVCTLFAGPSLHGVDRELLSTGVVLRPPVKRGDIERLVKESSPSNLAIVDGVFHAHPAVGHAEILEAVRAGWRIWGLSSMGAIRACEMDKLGMIGFGEVYRQFAGDPDMSDDEVTLMHQAETPFYSLSEPLIHIRVFLRNCNAKGLITLEQEHKIISLLKNMWYGYRTLETLENALLDLDIKKPRIDQALYNFSTCRIKNLDLIDFLTSQPWKRNIKSNVTNRDIP